MMKTVPGGSDVNGVELRLTLIRSWRGKQEMDKLYIYSPALPRTRWMDGGRKIKRNETFK